MQRSAAVIDPVRLHLLCFPSAGGGSTVFRGWATELPAGVAVVPVVYPGREKRAKDPPLCRLSPLLEAVGRAIEPYLDRPFAFFGHSMGALVAFELARKLRRKRSASPTHLFVSGRGAPHLPQRRKPAHRLPDRRFLDELRRLNGTPHEIVNHGELMRYLLPLLRADFAVCETYVYSPARPLDFPISAFGGLRDPLGRASDLRAWHRHTASDFHLRMFPGDHFFLRSSRGSLLRVMARTLEGLVSR